MEWASIIGSIVAVLFAMIFLPLALRARKKGGPQKVEQLLHHLQKIGVKASLLGKDAEEAKIGVSRASGQRAEGVIEIGESSIDYINVISVASQYGAHYFLDYLVKSSGWLGKKNRKKTRLVRKKSSGIWGKVIDIEWKGDDYLSRELNYDYRLKDKLLQAELGELKGSIWIFPEPKHEYSRVRTAYFLPSPDLFEAIDIIAKHIKSGG